MPYLLDFKCQDVFVCVSHTFDLLVDNHDNIKTTSEHFHYMNQQVASELATMRLKPYDIMTDIYHVYMTKRKTIFYHRLRVKFDSDCSLYVNDMTGT